MIRENTDWVVWSRAQPMQGDRTPRGFEHVGKSVFCGQVKRSTQEQRDPNAENEREDDAPDTEVEARGRACTERMVEVQ